MLRLLFLCSFGLLFPASAYDAQRPLSQAFADGATGEPKKTAAGSNAELPPLTGRVVDNADLLSPQTEQRLNTELAELEQRTRDQVVVVTTQDLKGEAIETYSRRLGNGWGIGDAALDNGVLLVVAPHERKVRIEVGRGLEGLLTDERAQQIIEEAILPSFRNRDLEGGLISGVEAIIGVLQGDLQRSAPGGAR